MIAAPDGARRGPGRWLILGLVMLAGVLNYVDRQAIAVLKPVIAADLKWSDADYGRLASLFQLAAAAGFLVAGRIADRLGVKWSNPVAVGAWSIAAMSHGLARSLFQFSLARIALGATESLGTPTGVKTVSSLFSAEQRAAALGISNAAGNIGAILTPVFVPVIALAFGWRAAFLVIGGAGLVWAATWIVAARGMKSDARAAAVSPVGVGGNILRDRRTWAIAGAKALSDQVWWLMLFWTPDFLHRVFHLGLSRLAAPLAVIYGGAAFGSVMAGVVSMRLIHAGVSIGAARKGALLVCALLVTPIPLAAHVGQLWVAVGLIGLMLAAHQGFSVNIFALVGDIVPADRVGRVTSFGSLCGNLAGMTVVFVAGEVLNRGWGYGGLLTWAACSYLLALGWLQALLPTIRVVRADGG